MSVPDLPEWVTHIVEEYQSDSDYERRYSEEFREMGHELQLVVVLIDLYPSEKDPVVLNDYIDCSVGEMYPILRNLEQDEIVHRTDGGKYRLAWRRQTEEKLKESTLND